MRYFTQEQRAVILLVFILLFIILTPLLEGHAGGELILVVNMYLTLVAATMELKERRMLFLSAIPIAGTSMVLLLMHYFHRTRALSIASSSVLAIFLALVSVSLFVYLGRSGQITSGRICVSVSLYFLLAMEWYALYNLLDAIQPGSFAEGGVTLVGRISPSKILYFSLATLTTLGYGDIVAVGPTARMLATLEAAAGVLEFRRVLFRSRECWRRSRLPPGSCTLPLPWRDWWPRIKSQTAKIRRDDSPLLFG